MYNMRSDTEIQKVYRKNERCLAEIQNSKTKDVFKKISKALNDQK